MKRIDLTGKRFGRLTVMGQAAPSPSGKVRWRCLCDCGNYVDVFWCNLGRGNTQSCGCYHREFATKTKTVHGQRRSKLYGVWCSMKARCANPNQKSYPLYGGRGITVCADWLDDFSAFYVWAMENGYKDGLTIDRIDGDKGYSPENCRWVTRKVQANNINTNVHVTYNGETHTLSEWADIVGSYEKRLWWRYKQGWPVEEILYGRKRK